MGKGWEMADIIPHLERAIHYCASQSHRSSGCGYYSLDSPHPAQDSSRGKGTFLPDPKEPLKTRFIFHEQPQSQGGAAVNNSAVPDWHDDPTWTANSG